jgi:MFS family permease
MCGEVDTMMEWLRMRVAALRAVSPVVYRIFVAVALAGLAGSIPEVIFNFYVQSLGYDNSVAGQLAGVVRLAGFVFGMPLGLMVDRFGGIRAIQAGALLNAVVWIGLVQSTDLTAMRALYFLAGLFASAVMVGTVPTLTRVVPVEQRAQVLGVNFSLFVLMGFLGALLGGWLPGVVATFRGISAVSAPAYQAVLVVPIVLSGAVLLVLRGVHARVLALAPQGTQGVAGDVAVATSVPLIILMTTGNLAMGFAGGIFHPFINLFFRQEYAFADATVGLLVAGLSLALGLGGMFGRPVVQALGPRRGLVVLLGTAAVIGAGTLIPQPWVAYTCYLLSTFLNGMAFPFFDLLLIASVAPHQRGLTKSVSSMQWSIGWAVAAFFSGQLQVQYGFWLPIVIFACGQGLAAVLAWYLPYRDQRSAPVAVAATERASA